MMISFSARMMGLVLLSMLSLIAKATESPTTAFYYANNLPLDLLATYMRVVVEPDNVSADELRYLKQKGVEVYAYFSVGEVGPERPWQKELKPAWKLGKNPGWNSDVMDMTDVGWRNYVIQKRLQALKNRGYDNFFLDTLDSYQLVAKTPAAQQKQQQGLIALVRGIKQHFGNTHLLFNRGFEVIDQLAALCDGVVAESLFKGWDNASSSYKDINDNDRNWLITKLKNVQERYHLPITILDYLPPARRDEARIIADKIKALGFTPWISTPAFDYMGVGALDLIPRKVLVLFDSNEGDVTQNAAHRLLAMPLEYLGFIPEYVDINQLPQFTLKGRYAGIVAWLNTNNFSNGAWVRKQIEDKVKIAFFNVFPFVDNNDIKSALQLSASNALLTDPLSLQALSKDYNFETTALSRRLGLPIIQVQGEHTPWLKVTDAKQVVSEPVFTAPWGGMALAPYLTVEANSLETNSVTTMRWLINPFEFLKAALGLEALPVADNTTENGRRIFMAHINAPGFSHPSEVDTKLLAAEIISKEFLQMANSLPHTVSISADELRHKKLAVADKTKLQAIARQLFSLPQVEIASYTEANAAQSTASAATITDAVKYINQELAPPGKQTQVLLWSDASLPTISTLATAQKLKLANVNGGLTATHYGLMSLTDISPSGIVRGDYLHVFAPVQNENSYTNNWMGPFYGYQEVINTFKLTDSPKRLKPIAIQYHFYSGDKLASVEALKRVYQWAQSQSTLPLWLSEYTPRLQGFREAVYEKTAAGWKIHFAEQLKTLRFSDNTMLPNMASTTGLAGYKVTPQGVYLSLNGDKVINLVLAAVPSSFPYLDNSNAQVVKWQQNQRQLHFRLKGHLPVQLALANFNDRCVFKNASNNLIKGEQHGFLRVFNFTNSDTGDLSLTCE